MDWKKIGLCALGVLAAAATGAALGHLSGGVNPPDSGPDCGCDTNPTCWLTENGTEICHTAQGTTFSDTYGLRGPYSS